MSKNFLVLCFVATMGTSAMAQTATVDGTEVAGKTVSKIEFPNNGESIKITYSDNSTAENLDLSEITISFADVVDAINYLNIDNENENAPIFYYDLQGRRISPLAPHLSPLKKVVYVRNGKKFIQK
jgi:hypothetical protein